MGVENVVCPECGKEALVTIPIGQRLISVFTNTRYKESGCATQICKCLHCKGTFAAATKDIE